MGNRGGRFHNHDGSLGTARWRSMAWICCRIAFRDRHREVMGAGYTELFFLDEATALAAGHRPCYECRRAAAHCFAAAAGRASGIAPPRAPEIDRILHRERRAPHEVLPAAALPPGTIFGAGEAFYLRTPGGSRRWSFAGYGPEVSLQEAVDVPAITPASTRAALAAGYHPDLHPSAFR